MKQKRIRIGRLDTAGGIAYEHGKILKKLMREMIDPQLATRGMFVNQRTLIEYENAEKRIAELEAPLEKLGQGKLIQLKTGLAISQNDSTG
jgi:hypothetical protein